MPTTTDLERLARTLTRTAATFDPAADVDPFARGLADGLRIAVRAIAELLEQGEEA